MIQTHDEVLKKLFTGFKILTGFTRPGPWLERIQKRRENNERQNVSLIAASQHNIKIFALKSIEFLLKKAN